MRIDEVRTGDWFGVEAKIKPPTRNHRPAMWENMLGTVMAMNDQNEVKYFDYNHEEAIEFANIPNKSDIRLYRYKKQFRRQWGQNTSEYHASNPRNNQWVMWVENT